MQRALIILGLASMIQLAGAKGQHPEHTDNSLNGMELKYDPDVDLPTVSLMQVAGATGQHPEYKDNFLNGMELKYDLDVDLSTPKMIRSHGYPAESHEVQTDDGYLLTLHRIPGRSRPVVFLQHGLLSSSADWIISGPGKALAYILWDSGYDVWMGNARGNTYSRSHVSMSSSDSKFWDFSFHEMGVYDLPAAIDYVLNVTGQENLFYVGHSMGTTMFFVMASVKTAYNAKVRAMFGLAPVAFVGRIQSPIRMLAPWVHDIEFILRFLGRGEFLPQNKIIQLLAKYGCEAAATEKTICENAIFVLCGFDAQQFNMSLLPSILSHTPAGTSTKLLVHFAQEVNSGKFQQYDYGTKGNQKSYDQTVPPEYNLTGITTHISLHVADNDWLADRKDVTALADQLQDKIGTYVVPLPNFNHVDFLWGKDANALVYTKVEAIMKRFLTSALSPK